VIASALIWIATALVACAVMEPWAALLHGRVWHGLLWRVHRSHHAMRPSRFEANDVLSALHAPIAIALILYGCRAHEGLLRDVAFGFGIGMSLFGLSYAVVHDGLVHGRLPVAALARLRYFARVRDAHRAHHRGRGGPYGLFLGPWERPRVASVHARLSRPSRHTRRARPSA
jgi:beta-carotene 3-hydroxylase